MSHGNIIRNVINIKLLKCFLLLFRIGLKSGTTQSLHEWRLKRQLRNRVTGLGAWEGSWKLHLSLACLRLTSSTAGQVRPSPCYRAMSPHTGAPQTVWKRIKGDAWEWDQLCFSAQSHCKHSRSCVPANTSIFKPWEPHTKSFLLCSPLYIDVTTYFLI